MLNLIFAFTSFVACQCFSDCGCNFPSFSFPTFSTGSQCSQCQLPPPPRQESSADQFNFHRDAANCQGAQDSMRANANDRCCNSRNADVANCNNARVKADANLCSNNNQFTESNCDEVLCHKKKARTECGDASARTANVDMDAGKNCRAAQKYNDNRQNQFCAGHDRNCRAEDCCHNDANGCASRSCGTSSPCGFNFASLF
ncbi:uncharacterized protein MONOS_2503 [Monocercomonoides exilis]|uniref:uncharacterized protein n=1 Tax=Monocercomonoides exilis TaxID=2049356 RepID=UPI0035595005|nr:hypothetical protein MONOS_2503 [Monocercomonoides exilis]|eukprot:MONOS_2503.1-p1 / transcript=MONOS_2503.1 / gene=MONOS_2503 / organism=Monocercomonoides_exilis_PA203 / gene_product=unspecified product / transcript_product=unspecified product / location=Mono_scaffold00052:50481-51083(-) / protein_length=201 / sequence_SO=supercontig / SO=protein_coding / is_pseudo=false